MGLLVRFEDRAIPFVLAALRNVARQVPVGGQDGIMVANAIGAVEGGKDEAAGHVIAHVPLTATTAGAAPWAGLQHAIPPPHVVDPTGPAGMTAQSEAGAPALAAPASASEPATASPAPLTADQEYEAEVAAAGEEYNRLLLAAQYRLNAAHTAQGQQ